MERTWDDVVEDGQRAPVPNGGVVVRNPSPPRKPWLTPQRASTIIGGVLGLVAVLALRNFAYSQIVSTWIGPVVDGFLLLFAIATFVCFGMLLGRFFLEVLGFLSETVKDVTRDAQWGLDPTERQRITSGDLRYESRSVLQYLQGTITTWTEFPTLPYDLVRREVADLGWRVTWQAACDLVNVDLHEDDPQVRRSRERIVEIVALAEDVQDRLHHVTRENWTVLQEDLEALEDYAENRPTNRP